MLELHFGDTSGKLREESLDVYKGIQSEILSTTRFDETSDLSSTHLGKVDRSKNNKIKVEESFPISECNNYFMVLARGTLGMTPVTSLGLVSSGCGERHIKNAMGGL